MVLNCVLNIVTLIVQKKNFIADDSFASWTELPLHARSQNLVAKSFSFLFYNFKKLRNQIES